MSVPPAREKELIEAITADPSQCIVLAKDEYRRDDGAVVVYRANLQEHLHRRLYRLLIDPRLQRKYLHRQCESWGCLNPWHYSVAAEHAGSRTHCPHGHLYLPGNLTPTGHCKACYEKRVAKRAPGLAPDAATRNAQKTHCPANHPYDEENTYIYYTPDGIHRKCRACTQKRNAAYRSRMKSRKENHR